MSSAEIFKTENREVLNANLKYVIISFSIFKIKYKRKIIE